MMYMHHDSSSEPSPACLCAALRKSTRAVSRLYEEAMDGTGMTIMQFSLLRHLARHGASPLSRLAELLVMDRTTLYRSLTPLIRQEWVTVDEGKGRSKIAALTPAGKQAMDRATPAWNRAQQGMLERMGHHEWDVLQSALAKVTDLVANTPA